MDDEQKWIDEAAESIFCAFEMNGVNKDTLKKELQAFLNVYKSVDRRVDRIVDPSSKTEITIAELFPNSEFVPETEMICTCGKCKERRETIDPKLQHYYVDTSGPVYSPKQLTATQAREKRERYALAYGMPPAKVDKLKRDRRASYAGQYLGFGSYQEYEEVVNDVWKQKPTDGCEVRHPEYGLMIWHEGMQLLLAKKNTSNCKCHLYKDGTMQCNNCDYGLFHEDI